MLWLKSSQKSFEGKDNNFAVPNPDLIDRILITDRDGNQADMVSVDRYWLVAGMKVNAQAKALMLRFAPKSSVYRGGYWVVNNEFLIRPEMIGLLLETMKKIQVMEPLSDMGAENARKSMIQDSKKVEIFMGEDEPVKIYHIGDGAPNTYGTYTVMESDGVMADQIYLTHIPNFAGYLKERYISDMIELRDRAVFRYLPENIQKVSVRYPEQVGTSFEISKTSEGSFEIINTDRPDLGVQVLDQLIATNYFSNYSSISIESYLDHLIDKDTTNIGPMFAVISVTDNTGEERSISLFQKPVTQKTKSQFDEAGNPMLYDPDRFYGEMNNGEDFIVAQYFVFGKLLKSYYFFLPEQAETPI